MKNFYEDEKTEKLVQELMQSSSYKIAQEDIEFIESYEARSFRLGLDYLKAELVMKKYGIDHTVVVFGSARICPRDVLEKNISKIKDELKNHPDSKELKEKLLSEQKLLKQSRYYDDAREFGRLVGIHGKNLDDSPVTLATGGGPGIMEAANRGAYDVEANSIGFNINLPREQYPNPYITPELCFQFHYFAIRKLHFVSRAKALVVYPGGFGTLDEFFEVLTLIQTKKSIKIPVVLVCAEYWRRVVDFDFLLQEGVVSKEDIGIYKIVDNANEAWQYIEDWYK